jgi:hypothetical protein
VSYSIAAFAPLLLAIAALVVGPDPGVHAQGLFPGGGRETTKKAEAPKPSFTWPRNSKRIALIIGQSAYSPSLRLSSPGGDADLVARALRSAKFDVSVGKDLNKSTIGEALRAFGSAAAVADDAVIYFGGHGMAGQDGINYVLPVDANPKTFEGLRSEAIALDELLNPVGMAKGLQLVILDGCRDKLLLVGPAGATAGCFSNVQSADNRTVVVSAAPGTVVKEGNRPPSPFARALADNLPKRNVELRALFEAVAADVQRATNNAQAPRLYRISTAPPFAFVGSPPAPPSILPPVSEDQLPEPRPPEPPRIALPPPPGPPPRFAPIIPVEQLQLHPEVAAAIRAARAAEDRAREKAKQAREAQAKAQSAAKEADAAKTASAKPVSYMQQDFAQLGVYEGRVTVGARGTPVRQGPGIWTDVNGEVYRGLWFNDDRNGYGISTSLSGVRFEGEWKDRIPCGVGVLIFKDGGRYEGEYCNGHQNGVGVYYFPVSPTNHDKEYAGEWKDDKRVGFGMRLWAAGVRSEGGWLNNEMSGYGADFDLYGQVAMKGTVSQQGVFENNDLKLPVPP